MKGFLEAQAHAPFSIIASRGTRVKDGAMMFRKGLASWHITETTGFGLI